MTNLLLDHFKILSVVVGAAAGSTVLGLTGGELVSLGVAGVTSGGVAFASLMGNRAKRYEAELAREETSISRLRDENRDLRNRLHTEEDESHECQEELVIYKIGVRLLIGQLRESELTPEWTPPSMKGRLSG